MHLNQNWQENDESQYMDPYMYQFYNIQYQNMLYQQQYDLINTKYNDLNQQIEAFSLSIQDGIAQKI